MKQRVELLLRLKPEVEEFKVLLLEQLEASLLLFLFVDDHVVCGIRFGPERLLLSFRFHLAVSGRFCRGPVWTEPTEQNVRNSATPEPRTLRSVDVPLTPDPPGECGG